MKSCSDEVEDPSEWENQSDGGPLSDWVPRRLTAVVTEFLEDEPVTVLQGPRSVGTSTLLRDLADACGRDATFDVVRWPPNSGCAAT